MYLAEKGEMNIVCLGGHTLIKRCINLCYGILSPYCRVSALYPVVPTAYDYEYAQSSYSVQLRTQLPPAHEAAAKRRPCLNKESKT